MRRHAVTASILLFILASAGIISAQINSSSITGTVTDPSAAKVPGVHVVAIQAASGLTRDTVTNSQGNYSFDDLPIGLYNISFKKQGFNEFAAEQVMQNVGFERTLNVRLVLNTGSDIVTVNEPIVQLDTVSATVGAPVEQEQVSELPINGRNWATLTSLVPGAIDNGAGDQRTIRFAGHGLDDNNLTLDGVDATAVFNQE